MEWLLVGNVKQLKAKTNLSEDEKKKLKLLKEELQIVVEDMEEDLTYL